MGGLDHISDAGEAPFLHHHHLLTATIHVNWTPVESFPHHTFNLLLFSTGSRFVIGRLFAASHLHKQKITTTSSVIREIVDNNKIFQ